MSSCQTVGGALVYVVSIVYSCEVSCTRNISFCNDWMFVFFVCSIELPFFCNCHLQPLIVRTAVSTKCAVRSAMKHAPVPLRPSPSDRQICVSKDVTAPKTLLYTRTNASHVQNAHARCARRRTNRVNKCPMIATLGQFSQNLPSLSYTADT